MAEKDRKKWDVRYQENLGGKDPSQVVRDFYGLAPLGRALDIACGNGRNSVFLAEKGFTVDAVDISRVAVNHLSAGGYPGVNALCRDLDTWKIPQNRYHLVVNVRFLDRRLFPLIQDSLKPGGLVVFESFSGGKNEEYCLKPNELLHAFPSFHVIYYQEKKIENSDNFDQVVCFVAKK